MATSTKVAKPSLNIETLKSSLTSGSEALAQSGRAALAGSQTISQAIHTMIHQNFDSQLDFFKTLSTANTLHDALELQQKAINETFSSVISNSFSLADLGNVVLTDIIDPLLKQLDPPHAISVANAA